MTHWSFGYVLRLVALVFVFAVLLRYFLHWCSHVQRMARVAEPQQLLKFLQRDGRFYGSQVILCLITLLLCALSYNLHRPPRQNYSPNPVYEVQVGDRNGAWDIGLGFFEVTMVIGLVWALSHSASVSDQIRLLWAVREQLQLDMHEYKLKA